MKAKLKIDGGAAVLPLTSLGLEDGSLVLTSPDLDRHLEQLHTRTAVAVQILATQMGITLEEALKQIDAGIVETKAERKENPFNVN